MLGDCEINPKSMILKSLQLTHFKNHPKATFDFGDGINCIVGKNGVGKTNLLDAIYYLSFTKSALGSQDRLSVLHEQQFFTLFGTYNKLSLAIQFEKGKSKILKIDGKEPEKLSDVIGKVPLVVVLPDDTSMITEGSEERRRFFDGALSQFDHEYLVALLSYNKILKQRNSLLKQNEGHRIDYKLVETYDDQLIPLALRITEGRKEIAEAFLPFLERNYQDLHEGGEKPSFQYRTNVGEDFEEKFRENFQRDQIMQRTLLGSHKDDFEFLLNNEPIKRFGSQGQQKTFIISIKLALYDFLREKKGDKPLLLLDDIFDKLDDSRIGLLVQLLRDSNRFGQIFLSDARKDRSEELFQEVKGVRFTEIGN